MNRPTETLLTCPRCHRGGFLAAGLKRHVCRPDNNPSPSNMPKPSAEKSKALVALHDTGGLITDKKDLAAFQANTAKQVALVYKAESENVLRRIFIGLALWRIKASLKHGEFGTWLKKHVHAGHNHINLMMRAAHAFVETTKLAQPDVLAITNGDFTLDLGKDALSRKVAAAAEKFVGELSWGELLDKHGIREATKLGGARTKGAPAASEPDAEQLYLAARDEIGGALSHAEELLVKQNRLQFLAKNPDEVRGVVASLRTLADRVEAAAKPLLEKQTA